MKKFFPIQIILYLILIVALICCGGGCGGGSGGGGNGGSGGGGGGTGGGGGGGEDPPSNPETPALKPGDLAVFFTVFLGADTNYFNEYGISIDTDTYAHLRFVPAANKVTLVDKWTSVSYAKDDQLCYTQDGKLFILNNNALDTYRFDLKKYDPLTNICLEYFGTIFEKIPWGSFKLVGNKLFYRNWRHWEVLYGDVGGELKVYDFDTSTNKPLLSYADHDNYGAIITTGGNFYTFTISNTGRLEIQLRDQTTGRPVSVFAGYNFADHSAYDYWNVEMSEYASYLLRNDKSHTKIELWKLNGGSRELLFSENTTDVPTTLDVEGSNVLIGFPKKMILYDDITKERNSYSFDVTMWQPELYKVP